MKIRAYLYDSNGENQEIDFGEEICQKLSNHQLLWVNVLERERETLAKVISALKFENVSLDELANEFERPKLDKFDDFYRFFINSVGEGRNQSVARVPIDFLVGKNVIITVQNGEVEYLKEFRNLDKGKYIGELDAESFIATLLDLHIVSYFRAVESVEKRVDKFDDRILLRDLNDEEFLEEMLKLRRDISKIRRWLLPHRDVFYALSRPDFQPIVESDSAEHFQKLNEHFAGLVDASESAREAVLSLFDLYTSRASYKMSTLIKKLTFVTIVFGALAVIVGAFGMNFEVDFFKNGDGFWLTLIAMGLLSLILLIVAKIKDWI